MAAGRLRDLELRNPVHKAEYRVLYADTDTGRVIYYGTYMRLLEIGRTEFMREVLGIPYSDLERQGVIFPVVEAHCSYKSPGFYDDLLEIKTSLYSWTRSSVRFNHHIIRPGDQRVIALGYTVHAAISPSGRLTRLPTGFVARLESRINPLPSEEAASSST